MARHLFKKRREKRRWQILAIAVGLLLVPAAAGGLFLKSEHATKLGLIEKDPVLITRFFAFTEAPIKYPTQVGAPAAEIIYPEPGFEVAPPLVREIDESTDPKKAPEVEWPNPPELRASGEFEKSPDSDIAAGSSQNQSDPESTLSSQDAEEPQYLLLAMTYPNQVAIGDSVKVTVSVKGHHVSQLLHDGLDLQLDSGSLDWGNGGGSRKIKEGRPLPIDVLFAAGTKDTGTATIVIQASASIPIAINTLAGGGTALEQPDDLSIAAESGSAPAANDIASVRAVEIPFQLAVERSVDVIVLSKYRIQDSWVQWLGIAAWFASFIGAGLLIKGARGLWKSWHRPRFDDGPPPMLHT